MMDRKTKRMIAEKKLKGIKNGSGKKKEMMAGGDMPTKEHMMPEMHESMHGKKANKK